MTSLLLQMHRVFRNCFKMIFYSFFMFFSDILSKYAVFGSNKPFILFISFEILQGIVFCIYSSHCCCCLSFRHEIVQQGIEWTKAFLKKSIKDKCMLLSLKKGTRHAIGMHQSFLQIHSCSLTSNESSFRTNPKMCNKSRAIYGQSVKHSAKQKQV